MLKLAFSLTMTGCYPGAGFSIGSYGYIGIGEQGLLGPWPKDIWEYSQPVSFTINRKPDIGREEPLISIIEI